MRAFLLLALLPLVLAGCAAPGTGTFNLLVTDAPDDIEDFVSLRVTVDKFILHGKDAKDETDAAKENETHKKTTYAPSTPTVDLVNLTNGTLASIFKDDVLAGSYKKLTIYFSEAKGTLKNGTVVDVRAPSGRLFVNSDFTVEEGKETDFTFDIQVHLEGDGTYALKPNASGSGPGKKGTIAEADGKVK